jgi:subtilisin family serine protease
MPRLLASLLLVLAIGAPSGAGAAGPADQAAASYLVVLEPGPDDRDVPAVAAEMARAHGAQLGFVYEHALEGFSVTMSPRAAAALARDGRVAYVEPDREVSIAAQEVPTGVQRIGAYGNEAIGIDGTDERVDVDVAVIDTGIDLDHPDLNVVDSVDCSGGRPWRASCKGGGDDDHSHGTHVAGTIGALDNDTGVVGVAPGARLHAVKVLNGNGGGYTSWIVAGIDWVVAKGDIEVINMSLGGPGYSQAEYDAIQGAVDAGVAVAVAAGNDRDDASNYSPAAFDNVLTVSAIADFDGEPGGLVTEANTMCRSDEDDTLADFSNFGPAVDIAAPGVCILSTLPGGSYGTYSGTSMASPHVAGALALLASVDPARNAADPEAAVGALYAAVTSSGNDDWIDREAPEEPKEPLLDVTAGELFAPEFVGGHTGDGGDSATEPELTGSSSRQGKTWTATVTSTAAVFGQWSHGGRVTDGCSSPDSLPCTNKLSKIPTDVGSVTFTTSGGTEITITKP